MAGEEHGAEEAQVAQTSKDGNQQAQEDMQVEGMDWQSAIKERDGRIAELEVQGEDQRVEFELRLAGVRNVKAARAVLDDHGGDINKLKEAEPWLFTDAPAPQQGGKTGLPNAGTSTDDGKTMRRWRKLAGLDDTNED